MYVFFFGGCANYNLSQHSYCFY